MNFRLLFSFLIILSLIGCFDVFQREDWRSGDHFVMTNPGSASSKTLYRDVGNGNGIGRLNDVEQIGANGQFIVAKGSGNQYYILEMTKDDPYMDARDVMLGPMDSLVFVERLRSLGIADLTFSHSFIR